MTLSGSASESISSQRFQNLPLDAALNRMKEFGDHSSIFLAANQGNEFFAPENLSGIISYRPFGRHYWVQFSGPIAPVSEHAELNALFREEARRQGRRIIGVQLLREDALASVEQGFSAVLFGCSYSIDLSQFSLRGNRLKKTRQMVLRSRREGVTVSEVDPINPVTGEVNKQLATIEEAWLKSMGSHKKPLRFLVGEVGGELQKHRRMFVAEADGKPVAYMSYSPVYGSQSGWLADVERRLPDAPPGVADMLIADAAEVFQNEGAGWLHMGLTPFVGLAEEYKLPEGNSGSASWLIDRIGRYGSALYPADSILAFKVRWRPHVITPEYLVFPGRFRLRDAWCLARTANAL